MNHGHQMALDEQFHHCLCLAQCDGELVYYFFLGHVVLFGLGG